MSPILKIAKVDRPRERLIAKGREALSELELLQIIIGSGVKGASATKIAQQILTLMEQGQTTLEFDKLVKIKGINTATATRLIASLEIAKRFAISNIKVKSVEDVVPLLSGISNKKQEHFVAITLDGSNRIIQKRTISIGTLSASLVHPREVYANAITDRAASIIVAHNHPGGSLEPSKADTEVTKRLRECGVLLGIRLLDHLIVTYDDYVVIT